MDNPQIAPPQIVLNQCFPDMGMLGEASGFDLDFRQLEAGKLRARCLLLAGFQNLVMRVEFDRKFHQRGCPPPGILTFGFPDPQSGALRWNGREAIPGALVNFNDGRFDGVNPGNFAGYTLSFSEDLLQEVAEQLGVNLNLASTMHTNAFWNPHGREHNVLRRNLRLLEEAAVNGKESGLYGLSNVFNYELAASVVRILAQDQDRPSREAAPFRESVLKRTLQLLDDPDQAPMSIAGICQTVGTSWSTLERAFAEEFGITPKAYIRSRRLAAVRGELMQSGPGTLIADVANHWGFWHMGRFAADYLQQFGELPSQTLRF